MSSISKSIKEKKRLRRLGDQPPLIPIQYEPAHIRDVRVKLENVPYYENCTREQLNGLAADLTSPDSLKSSYFGSYEDYSRSETASPMASLLPCPPFEQQETTLCVKIFLITPSSGRKRRTERPPQGACGGASTVLPIIEEEYGKRIIKASIEVNGQILTWGPENLVIPHGKAIPELASPVASLSLAARPQICEEPENGDVYSLEPCPGHKLDGFLKVVSNYNKTFMFDPFARNSIHFVRDALRALGFQNPPPPLQNRYSEYLRELKRKKSDKVPEGFKDHASLEHYAQTNFLQIKKNPFNVEFLLNHYVRFHWDEKSQAEEPRKWLCPKKECCMETLESQITLQQLFLNGFR